MFLLISSPAIKAVPFVGFRSPVRILKVVVLPAPVNRKQTAAQSLVDNTITINNDMFGKHHNNKQPNGTAIHTLWDTNNTV